MPEFTATLHDGTVLTATTSGAGPALILPVRTLPHDAARAESMRQWGADPDLGSTLVRGLSEDFRVIAADYEGHRKDHPATETLTPENLVRDLLAIADAAGAERFAYYGYSWLALAGLQLAVRTDRLWGLVMGGWPPLGGPYTAMLDVSRVAHEKAKAPQEPAREPVAPGDWNAAQVTVGDRVAAQFVTLYEALQNFDDHAAQQALTMPRLAFAGNEDNITYGPAWGDTIVTIAEPLARHRNQLTELGWDIELLPELDHMSAMHSSSVLPILHNWLTKNTPGQRGGVVVEVVQVEPQLVAGLRARVAGAELAEFFGRAMEAASEAGPLIAGPATAVYHEDAGDSFDTTIGFPLSGIPDASLGLEVAELPGGSGLRAVHKGPYDTLGEAYRSLDNELTTRGLQRTLAWERYLTGPGDNPDPASWTTEVMVPLPG